MDKDRIPPQNLDAEKAVLGSVLIDNEVLTKITDIVRPDFFYDPRNASLFESILALYSEGRPIDVLTLNDQLKKENKLKRVGGTAYISELIAFVPTSSNAEHYALLVKETAIRRKLIQMSAKFDNLARKDEEKLDDVINEVEKEVFSLSEDSSRSDFISARKLIEEHIRKADEFAKNPGALKGVPTGLKDLDHLLNGLHTSDLVIIAARPSIGKSALGFDIARHIASNEKKSVVIFSLEMPALQVMQRMIAQETRISLWNLRMNTLNEPEYARFGNVVGKLSESKIFIDETPGINIMQLRSKARRLKLEHSLDMILMDYLQLMQGHAKDRDNRTQEVGEISRSLKLLARELNVPVIALSQLNRAVENRPDRIPQLSDLRESGSIEQDADIVIFLSRELTNEEEEDKDFIKVDLSIAKHRNGPIGNIKLKFLPRITKFDDFTN